MTPPTNSEFKIVLLMLSMQKVHKWTGIVDTNGTSLHIINAKAIIYNVYSTY